MVHLEDASSTLITDTSGNSVSDTDVPGGLLLLLASGSSSLLILLHFAALGHDTRICYRSSSSNVLHLATGGGGRTVLPVGAVAVGSE